MDQQDKLHLEDAIEILGGNEDRLRTLNEQLLGTRDLDEADRRARVIMEYEAEQTQ